MSATEHLTKLRLMVIHLGITVTFFTSGLIINVAQLVLNLFLKPFNTDLFRRILNYLCYSLYSQLVFVSAWHSKSKLRVYVDKEIEKEFFAKENALLIMNHTYEIDWLQGWMFAERCGILGNCKAYAKKVISYVPVIGWAWALAEFVFLERSYDKDKEIISRQLKAIFAYPEPTWLLLNAEGTRFTPKKHEASVKFAEERGMRPLKHHLIPRSKGFTASLPSLRGRCAAIYDINLSFKRDAPYPPTISNLMRGLPVEGYMFVRRIPLDVVPINEDAAAEWLQQLFVEKDRLQESFHSTGSFFDKSGFHEVPYSYYNPRLCCYVNFILWSIFSLSLLLFCFITSLINCNWIGLSIALGILLIFYILMDKAVGMSEISKASSYGAESKPKAQ